MYFDDHGQIIYSPSDLTRFMESPFAAWMDRLYLEHKDRVTPDEASDELQIYADAGISHEANFVKSLESQGHGGTSGHTDENTKNPGEDSGR